MARANIIWFHIILGLFIATVELYMNDFPEVTFWTAMTSFEWFFFKRLGLI